VPYAAAKGGVNAITACLAFEYAQHGIRVCGVAPAARQVVDQTIASSLMHRYGTAEEQTAAILFLASDEASYITGMTLPVAGGDLG
jgi:dihydroxycyclohexadiene carboxylate dehydrogenase